MRFLSLIVAATALIAIGSPPAFSHGGRLNSEGCHNNRKTGDYHCHRSSAAPASRSTSSPSSNQTNRKQDSTSWSYRNCTEARAAGAAPVLRGEPGFGPHLDRDGDGVGCE